ncbi:MAG: glycoside hydrolase [Bacteroidetes bacterium]|nr:glycoside hydrolase [Bacteroidota bacterium]
MRILVCLLILFLSLTAFEQDLIGYYNSRSRPADPARFHLDRLTHVIYCFGYLKGGRIALTRADSSGVRRFIAQKPRFPNLKVLVAIGGWEGCPSCPGVFASETGRKNFAQSVTRLLNYFQADGIDIDWEFPERPDDFTALMRTLRDSLGTKKELSFAAAGFAPYLQRSYDWKNLMPLVTRVNLMTYDLIGSRSPITGHHAALFSSGPQTESADHAIHYLDSLGVPCSKVAIGAGLYAREFDGVPNLNHGLFQTGKFRRLISLGRMQKLEGFRHYWDSTARAAYSYNAATKVFLTYDDLRSITAKSQYVTDQKLGGLMFWELNLDPRGSFLDTLYGALR